jgi:hypothetical protein
VEVRVKWLRLRFARSTGGAGGGCSLLVMVNFTNKQIIKNLAPRNQCLWVPLLTLGSSH